MEARNKFFIVLCLATFCFSGSVCSTTFTFKNNCPYTVWPATLTGGGKPQLSSTGFELPSRSSRSPLSIPPQWSGRVWGRTGCSSDASGKLTCASADCGSGQLTCNGAGAAPPASLVELTLGGSGGQDFFDVSLVDGFNLPVAVAPQGGSGSRCTAASCGADINAACPAELAVRGPGGSVVGCKSACVAFNKPQYCCTGAYGTPATCPPTKYSQVFKARCPQAYSYAYDDKTSTFTCSGGPDYLITFCP